MSSEDLQILKSKLPRNFTKILAERCNCSTGYVSMILNGDRASEKVIDEAIKLAEEEKIKQKSKSEKIKKL